VFSTAAFPRLNDGAANAAAADDDQVAGIAEDDRNCLMSVGERAPAALCVTEHLPCLPFSCLWPSSIRRLTASLTLALCDFPPAAGRSACSNVIPVLQSLTLSI